MGPTDAHPPTTRRRLVRRSVVLVAALLATVSTLPHAAAQPTAESTAIVVLNEAEFRQALLDHSGDPNGPHTIVLGADITLNGSADPAYTGDQALTIDGQGQFALDGGGNSRALAQASADTQAPLLLTGVTIRNASTTGTTAAIFGGAVNWLAAVTVTGSTFEDNSAMTSSTGSVRGGALASFGTLTIMDSTFTGNTSQSTSGNTWAGAAYASDSTTTQITGSTFVDNDSSAPGGSATAGAVFSSGPLLVENSVARLNEATGNSAFGGALAATPMTIDGSLLSGNHTAATTATTYGGAVLSSGVLTVADSALVDNEADGGSSDAFGGALRSVGLDLRNSTVSANRTLGSVTGGAVHSIAPSTVRHATITANESTADTANLYVAGGLTVEATVIADPIGGTNCDIVLGLTSEGYNYDTDGTCGFGGGTGDVANGADPGIGPARDNGDLGVPAEATGNGRGRPSAFPLAGSPLTDAIPIGSCTTNPMLGVDQRGVGRPFGAGCDIGAIESVFPPHDRTDVTSFYEPTVRWVTSSANTPQILNGFSDGTFGQTLNITRGQVARMYHRAAGEPGGSPPHGFSDVTPFYENAVRWAKAEGIFDGFSDNTFHQADPISRGNYTRSLYQFAGAPATAGLDPHGFNDVTPFYETAVIWAAHHGLADGFADNTFRQTDNINRGNATRVIYNLARTPGSWNPVGDGPANMLFRSNLIP